MQFITYTSMIRSKIMQKKGKFYVFQGYIQAFSFIFVTFKPDSTDR